MIIKDSKFEETSRGGGGGALWRLGKEKFPKFKAANKSPFVSTNRQPEALTFEYYWLLTVLEIVAKKA